MRLDPAQVPVVDLLGDRREAGEADGVPGGRVGLGVVEGGGLVVVLVEVVELDPLGGGEELVRGGLGVEQLQGAAGEGAVGAGAALRELADAEVGGVEGVVAHEGVVRVGGLEDHADGAAREGLAHALLVVEELAAHGVVDPAHVVEELERGDGLLAHDGLGPGVVLDAPAVGVRHGGEHPPAGVVGGHLRVGGDAGDVRLDLLGEGAHVVPRGGRGVGVEPGLLEDVAVVGDADREQAGGDGVDVAVVVLDVVEGEGVEVLGEVELVEVGGHVRQLAVLDELVAVGEGHAHDRGEGAPGELRLEGLGLPDLGGGFERDVGVGGLELGDAVVEGRELFGLVLGRLVADGDGDVGRGVEVLGLAVRSGVAACGGAREGDHRTAGARCEHVAPGQFHH
nr:hypothetical protein GCM10025732_28040 [Glycomyces mayteni]